MSNKELRLKGEKLLKEGIKKIVQSKEFKELIHIANQISSLRTYIKCVLIILGVIFIPTLTCIYFIFDFLKIITKIALIILEVEREDGVKILSK